MKALNLEINVLRKIKNNFSLNIRYKHILFLHTVHIKIDIKITLYFFFFMYNSTVKLTKTY